MFEPVESAVAPLTFLFDGQPIRGEAGTTLAAALLAAGHDSLRDTHVSQTRRGPYCMMGACYDCLVVIDGETRQACMVEVREGLEVSSLKPGGAP